MATLVDTTPSLDIVLIDVAMPEWTPDNDSFDWSAFSATFASSIVLPEPQFDANGNIVTTPGEVTSAPNDPDSGWNSNDMAFITNANGETADFHVAYDANGVAHYTIPDGTDATQTTYLQEAFADWL